MDHIAHIAATDWTLDDPRAVTGYAPSYARSVHDMPSQIAIFRRGDSALVVGAWDARRDTTLLGRDLVAAIAFAGDYGLRGRRARQPSKAIGRLTGIGVIDSGLVSLELLATSDKRAARVRTGLPPRAAGRIGLSSLLLYAPSSEPAYDIAAVKDSALASAIIPSSRSVGVYWETYGANRGRRARALLAHRRTDRRELGADAPPSDCTSPTRRRRCGSSGTRSRDPTAALLVAACAWTCLDSAAAATS